MALQHHVVLTTFLAYCSLWTEYVTPKDVCQNEQFSAECGSSEMIVITEAQFGRMNRSRCVTKDYGYISCVSDVLDVADHFCSGRRKCTISVPNDLLEARKTCPKDLISYLHASYQCVKIITKHSCKNEKYAEVYAQGGILASMVTSQTGCGSRLSPYIVKAHQGQRLNFTLQDFSYLNAGSIGVGSVAYAVINDGEKPIQRKTIHGTTKRTTHAYLSETNIVQVIFFGTENGRHFALEYQVIGCTDPLAPAQGWVKRKSADEVVVGCNHTDTQWKLVCVHNKWQVRGNTANCSLAVTSSSTQWQSVVSMMSINIELALALIAGIAFVIAAVVILVGILFIRSRNYHRSSSSHMPVSTGQWPRNTQPSLRGQGQQQEVTGKYSGSIRSQENEYAFIQDNTYGTNSRSSKYLHINLCHQGEPVGTQDMSPDTMALDKKETAQSLQHRADAQAKCRVTAVVNNNNKPGQRQYFVLETGSANDVAHDERAYSY